MTTIVLGSRSFYPLSAVDEAIKTKADVVAFGVSRVAVRAEQLGARRRPLETNRQTLIDLASEPDTETVLFVARDPETKMPTKGMADIQTLMDTKGIAFSVVSSPLPGAICDLIANLDDAVEKLKRNTVEWRREQMLGKVLGYGAIATQKRNEYRDKLESGQRFEVGNPDLDARWIRWLTSYECLCDALTNAELAL